MKDLLLGVHVVVKIFNLKTTRRLADSSKNYAQVRAARLFFLVYPMRSLFSGVVPSAAVVLSEIGFHVTSLLPCWWTEQ